MRTLLPFHPAMSAVGGLLTYVLFVGAILFPQVFSDDLQNLYRQGNLNFVHSKSQLEPSRFQNYSQFLQRFVQGQVYPEARNQDAGKDKAVPQATSENQNINGLKASDGGLSKKQWYIIGGTVLIVLIIIFAIIILCLYNKKKKQKKIQRALHQKSQNHPSDPPFRVPFDNVQLADPLSNRNTVMAEINVADSINFQENPKQNFDKELELQDNQPNVTTFTVHDNVAVPSAPVASSQSYETDAGFQKEMDSVKPVPQGIVVENNVNPADKMSSMEGHLSSSPQKKGIKYVMDNNKDLKASKFSRKRYDSQSGTSDIDPKSREHHIMREYDRDYDSDQSRYGHDNAAYDYYSEHRIHDRYGIPRLECEVVDPSFLYINERSRNQISSDGYSNDYHRQHKQQLPRRIEDYGGINAHHMLRESDPRKHNFKYDHRYGDKYTQRPYSRYDNPAPVKRQSRHNELEDNYAATIKDSRFKDPFSRDVRHELGAVIANNSFNQNNRAKGFVDARVRRDSYTIYTSSGAPQHEYIEHRAREPSITTNTKATPVAIPLPKPDYQQTDSEELLVYKPTKKPPVLYPKPVVQTVVKPREFKGPYGPEDLDELNNPYTLKRGKTQRPVIE